jgi:ABC-2 type transport system ATP-binding protein
MPDVIVAEDLTKYYGPRRGLDGLDLCVHEGEIYGFLGPNGAGKTTTIRLLLDLLRPTRGRATIFGVSPRTGGPALRRRIGYLPGDLAVEGNQTAAELLVHLGHLRGGVERGRIDALADRLDLDLGTRISRLSKGNRQKVGVVQAFMHEPELLVLDEPTIGLDPIIQQRFVELAHEARAAGRTVFMSSHILSEVQRTADRVGIVRNGRLVAVESVESLRRRAVQRIEVQLDESSPAGFLDGVAGVADVVVDGRRVEGHLVGRADDFLKAIARVGVARISVEEPDLEELFLTYYGAEGDGDAVA